jgi:four helix bundle protein
MTPDELKRRTRAFALRIIRLAEVLPRTQTASVIQKQIVRSGTSVGANYRAACRARSRADFAAKLAIAEEEADETLYWLELLAESGLIKAEGLTELRREAHELVAIITASRKTAEHGGHAA